MKTLKKEELYTFDELNFIKRACLLGKNADEAETCGILEKLAGGVAEHPDSTAVFFMPSQTFSILSMFQGNTSLCKINAENVENMLLSVKNQSSFMSEATQEEKLLIERKLQFLCDYLKSGNSVEPVTVPVDQPL